MKKIFIFLIPFLFCKISLARSEQIEIMLDNVALIDNKEIIIKEKINLYYDIYKAEKLPAPTIIVLHGCAGVDTHHKDWAETIKSWGYNAVVLDSFSGVAKQKVCDNFKQVLTVPNVRATSALHLAEHIHKQEWSTNKIGAIGFSHGGWTVLWLSSKEHRSTFQNPKIVSAVAYYPNCASNFRYHRREIPLEIHHGAIDNWTPLSRCTFLSQFPGWSLEIEKNLFVYKDSHHGFDMKNYNWSGQSASGFVTSKTNDEARELSMKRTKEFFDRTLK